MRVLLTTDTVGGVWTFTRELATGLLARGHAVALVSFGREPSPTQATWAESIQDWYCDRFRYVASTAPLEWMTDNHTAYSAGKGLLLDYFESFAPDIFHTSQFCFGALPLSVPKLITAHSDVLSWAAACRPTGLESSTWLTQYVALVQEGLHEADAVAAPTRWMLNALKRNFNISCPRHAILNGRTLAGHHVEEPRAMQAVSVGRFWDEAKNLSLLTEVESPMPIVIAGEQQQDASSTPHLGRVRTLGVLDQEALSTVLRTSTVYIAPSLYEPFGLAPLEAALCGCAVLANDLPSFREVWGDAALYFHDAPSLTRLLHHLNDSPDALMGACSQANDRALELSADEMTEAYLSLYRNLIEQSSPATSHPQELAVHAC
jgi:glycogen(starch) synthase